jgi:hypothetical protein
LRGSNQSRSRNSISALVKYGVVFQWLSEVSAVQRIEEFPPELHIEGFRESRNVVVLREGKIKV